MRGAIIPMVALLAACFAPDYRDDLECGQSGECPEDHFCHGDRICRSFPATLQDACDPVAGGGCPAGQKCIVSDAGGALAPRCVAAGTGVQGNLCDTTATMDSCAPQVGCHLNSDGSRSCQRFCNSAGGSSECTTESGVLSFCVPIDGYPGVGMCAKPCDPLDHRGCGTGDACYVTQPAPQCAVAGSLAAGQSCSAIVANVCARGSTCLRLEQTGEERCFFHCNAGGGPPSCAGAPTGGNRCAAVSFPGAGSTFGICVF